MDDVPEHFPFPPPLSGEDEDGVKYILVAIEVDDAFWLTYISHPTMKAWWAQVDLRPYLFTVTETTDIFPEDFVLSQPPPDRDAFMEQGQDLVDHARSINGSQDRESIMAQLRAQIIPIFILEKDETLRSARRAEIKRRRLEGILPCQLPTLPTISSFFSSTCQRFSNLPSIPEHENQVVTTNETQEIERRATPNNETAVDHKRLRAFLISKGVGAYNRRFVSRCIALVDKMDDICTICHENDKNLLMTTCFHFMCEECWGTLVKNMTEETIRCPYCRSPFHEGFRFSETPHQRRVPKAWIKGEKEGTTELLGRVPVKTQLGGRRVRSNVLCLNVPRWGAQFATLECTPKMVDFFRKLKDEYSKRLL